MCGIAGQVRPDGLVEPKLIERMCAAIEHRGPDSRGVFVQQGVGLGIQRLRIIDLETGDQPIFNEDRSVVVVLNGEIYNFLELREALVRAGHTFRTRTDTEVIVHLYEEEGPGCVRSLHGMFAFALWDLRKRRLMLARDRLGKKPLFYAHRDDALSFSSELGSLLADEEIPRDIDHQALDCYYTYQYIPAPLSAFRAIRKLPPATVLTYCEGDLRLERYWRLRYSPKLDVRDPRELRQRVLAEIEAAVKRRLIADVPLGAFLSGGIDSSAVVAAMARHSHGAVKTFSIGFADARFNELPSARLVAERFSTEHHEFVIEPDAIEILPRIVRHYGEPFADSSAIPSFYVAEATRRHVTVALNGDGGDESFGGYNRYVSNVTASRLTAAPSALWRSLGAAAARLPERWGTQAFPRRLRHLSALSAMTAPQRYAYFMSIFDRDQREQLYTREYSELIGQSRAPAIIESPWKEASGSSLVDVMLETDVETYLPGDLLVKMDIATMASSLEARSPLLDHQLMEFAASLPAEFKLRGRDKKVILRDALREWLPGELLDRPKMGFVVPIREWFKAELRDYVADVLLDSRTRERGYFQATYVERLLRDHRDGIEDNSARIWALLVAELWHREYLDRPASQSLVGRAG